MGPVRTMVIVGITLVGIGLAAPVTWMSFTHDISYGRPMEILVKDLGNGQATLAIAYEYETPVGNWIGWDQGQGSAGPNPDMVLPLAEARSWAERMREDLRSEDPAVRRRTQNRVYYEANDPGGTAFMSVRLGPYDYAHRVGVTCVAFSLFLSLPIPWGRPRPRRRIR